MGRTSMVPSKAQCVNLSSHFRPPSHPLQDEQLHFAHPIIASTAKSFYFNKWHTISTDDPDTFSGSVPKPLIALIGTVVCYSILFRCGAGEY